MLGAERDERVPGVHVLVEVAREVGRILLVVAEGEVHRHRHVAEPREVLRHVAFVRFPVGRFPEAAELPLGQSAQHLARTERRAGYLRRVEAERVEDLASRRRGVGDVVDAERIVSRPPVDDRPRIDPGAEEERGPSVEVPGAVLDLGTRAAILLERLHVAVRRAVGGVFGRVVRVGQTQLRMAQLVGRRQDDRRQFGGVRREDQVLERRLARLPEAVRAADREAHALRVGRHLHLRPQREPRRRAAHARGRNGLPARLPVLRMRGDVEAHGADARRVDLLHASAEVERLPADFLQHGVRHAPVEVAVRRARVPVDEMQFASSPVGPQQVRAAHPARRKARHYGKHD